MLGNLRGKRVLVTGAGGFVGRHVLEEGVRHGVEVYALARRDPVNMTGVKVLPGDLTNPAPIQSALEEVQPQGILHLAAAGVQYRAGALQDLLAVNAGGLAVLLAAAARQSVPPVIVCAGSGFEYAPKPGQLRESDPACPNSEYGVSKAAATLIAQFFATRLSVTVLRLFSIFGPGEKEPRLVPYVISQSQRGLAIELTPGEQIRDYTYVGDIAEAFWRALSAPPVPGRLRILNVSSGFTATLKEFVEILAEVLQKYGLEPDLRFGARAYRADELMYYAADASLLRDTLCWSPSIPLSVGLEMMVKQCLRV